MIGDRDGASYDGYYQRLVEGQIGTGDFSSWRNFLYAGGTATQLSIRTHGGSQAFANPTFTPLRLPNGEPGVVVTQFVPSSAAAPGEAGELVYYRPQDPPPPPTIAAAGDISCQNTACHDDETSELLVTGRAHEGADARRQPVRARRAGQLREVLPLRLGPGEGDHDADAGQPRPTVLGVRPLFRQAAELLVRPRSLASDRARLDRHHGRHGVPRRRPGPVRGAALHPRLLAPPALLVGRHARQQFRDRAALDPAGGGRSRRDPERPRPHL